MGIIGFGVIMIVGGMIVTMGVPFVIYSKRDQQWLDSSRSLEAWYN